MKFICILHVFPCIGLFITGGATLLPGETESKDRNSLWGKPVQGLRLSVKCAQEDHRIGNKIGLEIDVQNVTSKTRTCDSADPLRIFRLRITGPDGKQVPMTKRGEQIFETVNSIGSLAEEKLQPKELLPFDLELTEIWAIRKPGKYQIVATMDVPKTGEEKKFVTITSNPLTITIAPAKEKKGK